MRQSVVEQEGRQTLEISSNLEFKLDYKQVKQLLCIHVNYLDLRMHGYSGPDFRAAHVQQWLI